MRLLPFLALAPLASAQYFSEGWKPGQPEPKTQDAPAPAYTPGAERAHAAPTKAPSLSDFFSINTLLTSSPVASLFERFGVNITERVALTQANLWDERIPLITDDNFQELIVREPLTEEEEQNRVWIAVITVTAAKQDGISKYLDQVFDSAYNETLYQNDLPNVRWGRIDYLNVTYLTTKWNVWQAPYLVVMTDRGSTLRFYRPQQLRLRDHALRDFLQAEGWKNTPAWESRYAPGGDREWIMDVFATYLTKIYNVAVLFPRWLLLVISGGVGSLLLNLLHRPSKNQPVQKPVTKRESSATLSTTSTVKHTPDPTTSKSASATTVKSEPAEKPAASTTATTTPPTTPRRTARKGKGRKQQA
ncbi:hypothetical protein NP233_g574 [Leucocoprinus birnbaumii]|uniref:Uncharacterized protein n=1 Tax=Leucocoprinus birnbaumii TaxID=56174 RepID=A0AAD5YYK1_9AGAR|nr:hypothetical protein NP233_g574 [Leucocoprinus birnbaumii]